MMTAKHQHARRLSAALEIIPVAYFHTPHQSRSNCYAGLYLVAQETARPALPAPCSCCECPTCDARIDRWHDGYFAHRAGEPCPADAYAAEGWNHRRTNMPWEAVDVIERPEGYYHQPLGTFA